MFEYCIQPGKFAFKFRKASLLKTNRTDRAPRHPRRGGFNDDFMASSFYENRNNFFNDYDNVSPKKRQAPSGPVIKAVVKWFNSSKGFGFAELSDGSGDAFLHINSITPLGFKTVNPGTILTVRAGNGPKGSQITEVLTIDADSAESPIQSSDFQASKSGNRNNQPRNPRPAPDLSQAREVTGTVKWYNPIKGFGFITPENNDNDIFVHISALERSGINELNEGQSVIIKVVSSQKGAEAASITLI